MPSSARACVCGNPAGGKGDRSPLSGVTLAMVAALFGGPAGYIAHTSHREGPGIEGESAAPASGASEAAGATAPEASGNLEDTIGLAIESVVSIISDEGRGSGFLVDPETVITNHHVVGGSENVLVKLSNGRALSGTVERIAERHDLALVRPHRELVQGGGPLASEVAMSPAAGLTETLGGTAAPASTREESEFLQVVESARPQFESLAPAVANCPAIAREFEGDKEGEVLMRLGRIVLEDGDQRRG